MSATVVNQYKLARKDTTPTTERPIFRCPLGAVSCERDTCAAGYTGPLCNVCDEGYSRSGLVGVCTECSGDLNVVLAIVGGLVILALVSVALYTIALGEATSGKLGLAVTLGKIATSMGQILVASQAVFNLSFPEEFVWLLDLLKVFAMDLFGFLRLGCLSGYEYSHKLSLAFVLPLILLGCVTAVYFARRQVVPNMFDRAIKMSFAAIFLVYAFIAQAMFESFACRDLGPELGSWLAVDYQTSCDDSRYTTLVSFSTLGVLVYPIGVPAGTLYVLWKSRSQLTDRSSTTFTRYSFLVADYLPEFWYWECIEMLRKVILTGVISVYRRGSLFQVSHFRRHTVTLLTQLNMRCSILSNARS